MFERLSLPKRKALRLPDYDYAADGVYFVTVCTAEKKWLFWRPKAQCRGDLWSPGTQLPLSAMGRVVAEEIEKMAGTYPTVQLDCWCIMPDHIHLLLRLQERDGLQPPTLSRVMQQFKGSVTKRLGCPVWQKSFLERVIRNATGYQQVWRYIAENPWKLWERLEPQQK